jgi:hypothetical protein
MVTFSIQPSDKDAADNPMNVARRSVDGAINYSDSKTTSSLDDYITDADDDDDDDDMIDFIQAKQRHCVSVCAAVAAKFGTSIDIATCAFHYCSTASMASSAQSVVPSPTKRWGSRLCMEIHCRSLEHDISSYVNCGVRHCTK